METPEGVKAFRVALADCAAEFCKTTAHKLSPEDMTLAVFQLAAVLAFARGGETLANMQWAVRNFTENLATLHGGTIEIQLESDGHGVSAHKETLQ